MCGKIDKLNKAVDGRSGHVNLEIVRELGVSDEFEFVRKLRMNATGGRFDFQENGLVVSKKLTKRGLDVSESSVGRNYIPSSKPSKRFKPTHLGLSSAGGGSAGGSSAGGGSAGGGSAGLAYISEEEEEEDAEDVHLIRKPRFQKLVGDVEKEKIVDLKTGTDNKFLDYLVTCSTLGFGPIAEVGSRKEMGRKNCVVLTLTRGSGSVIAAKATMKGSKPRILKQFQSMCEKAKGKGKGRIAGGNLQERVLNVIRANGGTASYSDMSRLDPGLSNEINVRHRDVTNNMVAVNMIERVGSGIFRIVGGV